MPARAEMCPSGYGIANSFANKLQGKECEHCKDIYDNAINRQEEGQIEQTYDIHVARSLCSDATLQGSNKYWQLNIMVLVFFLIAVIALCLVYEVFRNREIALTNQVVDAQKGGSSNNNDQTIDTARTNDNADTERKLVKS